jgi:hypothetical protein
MFVVPPQPLKQVPSAHEGRAKSRRRDTAAPARFAQHVRHAGYEPRWVVAFAPFGDAHRLARERFVAHDVSPCSSFAITAKAEDGTVYEVDGYLTVNLFPDGRVAEFFVKLGKQGDFHAIVDQWAKAASWALQLGAPLEKFMKRFVNVRFEPAGITQNPDIPMCSSLCDYVARFLILRFGKSEVLP